MMPVSRSWWRSALVGALVAAVVQGWPAGVGAQVARGVVVDRGDNPVPGVVVQLVDSARAVVARTLSNERGEFRLLAPAEASYTIATLRIGFRPTQTGPFALRRASDIERRLILSGLSASLDTVRVSGRSVCGRAAADSAAVTFGAWEQVRAALTATELSTGANGVVATTVGYRRTLDPLGMQVRREVVDVKTDSVRQPWGSATVDDLHQRGYISTLGDSTVYFAPGLDMLVSTTFIEDHCFHLASSRDKTQLGIAFEPTRDRRRIADIRGTLWLDRASAELRALEYRYTNVSVDEEHSGSGGVMEFARMAHGAWVITRWSIRMPVVERRMVTRGFSRRAVSTVPENVVTALAVDGGDLALVRRGTDTLWMHAPLTLAGTVRDSASGRGVAGARLALVGTTGQSVSDGAGRFEMPGLLPGEHVLEVRTASLDSLGAVHQMRVTVTDNVPALAVRVPAPTQLVSALCGRRIGASAAGPGIVIGTARLAGTLQPPRHLKVSAEWAEIALRGGSASGVEQTRRYLDALSDTSGNFRLCGVPVDAELLVTGTSDEGTASPVSVRLAGNVRLTRVELDLDLRALASAEFAGVVVDSSGAPIADAEVAILALHKSLLTTDRGAFRLRDIMPGTYQVVVRKIGWGPLNVAMAFAANQTAVQRIVLTRVTVLEEVTVTVATPTPWRGEFEENRRLGLGRFLTRDDLAKREGQTMTVLLQEMPGVALMRGTAGHAWLTNRRGPRGTPFTPDAMDSLQGAQPRCYAQVYLDNVPVFSARAGEPLFDLSSISTDRIEAIEYYDGPAQTPMKYSNLNSHCGVLVIHRRISP